MKRIIFIGVCLFAHAGFTAGNSTVYTSTKTKCKTLVSDTTEGGSYEIECAGVGGYKIRLLEGDVRQTLNVIAPGKKTFELNFWGYYSGFSSIGEKVEWRKKGKVPVALIARFNVSDSENEKKTKSYLMVSKIGKTSSCVTDIVPPQAKQNEQARVLADAASTKECKPLPTNIQ